MQSKLLLTILLTATIIKHTQTFENQAEIRGTLLYHKANEKSTLINPSYVVYYRQLYLADIAEGVKVTETYTKQYKQYCEHLKHISSHKSNDIKINNYDLTNKYVVIPSTVNLKDIREECSKIDAKLPEPRSFADIHTLLRIKSNLTIVLGLHYENKTQTVRYLSDNTQTILWDKMTVNIPNSKSPTPVPIASMWAQEDANRGQIILDNESHLSILYDKTDTLNAVICEKHTYNKPHEINNNFLYGIAYHMCQRDYKNMESMTRLVKTELSYFESPPSDDTNTFQSDTPFTKNTCKNKFDEPLVDTLVRQIIYLADKIVKEINYPLNIIQQYIVFNITNTHEDTTFKQFLQEDTTYHITDQKRTLRKHITCLLNTQTINKNIIQAINMERLHNLETDLFQPLKYLVDGILIKNNYVPRHKRQLSSTLKDTKQTLSNSDLEISLQPIAEMPDDIFVKSSAAYFLGIVRPRDLTEAFSYVIKNAQNIGYLSLNQLEIKKAYKALTTELQTLQNITHTTDLGIAAITNEIDSKRICTDLQNLIRTSLLILANAITSAQNSKASPYVFPETLLHQMATDSRNKNIYISNKLEDINTKFVKINNRFFFIFSIPILDREKLFRLYTVNNFPIFGEDEKDIGTTYFKDEYIGISVDNTKYIKLSINEYTQCTGKSFCYIANTINTINENSSCVATTYKYKNNTCPIIRSEDTTPYFITYNNVTHFSTPRNYHGNLICPNYNIQGGDEDVTGRLTFSGMGSITISASCFIELPDGRKVIPHYTTNAMTDLGPTTLTEAFNYIPTPENYQFNITRQNFFENQIFPEIILKQMENVDMKTMAILTLKVISYIPIIVIVILIIISLIVIFTVLYCTMPGFEKGVKNMCKRKNKNNDTDTENHNNHTNTSTSTFETRHSFSNEIPKPMKKLKIPSRLTQEYRLRKQNKAIKKARKLNKQFAINKTKEIRQKCEAVYRPQSHVRKENEEPYLIPNNFPPTIPSFTTSTAHSNTWEYKQPPHNPNDNNMEWEDISLNPLGRIISHPQPQTSFYSTTTFQN